MIKISIGADHRGFELKEAIKKHFGTIEWVDVGTHDTERTDYPIYAQRVVQDIANATSELGILICGSGAGIAMAANRSKGIYAAVCWNPDVARVVREHDAMNVLVLPADFVTADGAYAIIDAWLKAEFKGGRYAERLGMMD